MDLLLRGGWTMLPLLACSLLAITVLIQKGIQFWLQRVFSSRPLEKVAAYVKSGDLEILEESCQIAGTPLGDVMAHCASLLRQGSTRTEEDLQRRASVDLERLERFLPLLSFVAQAAPLFGLLGTVIGMVELFSSMEAAGSQIETSSLSSGIWQALLTTAAGLMIAIPALGAHLWLTRVIDRLRIRMQDGIGQILTAHAGHQAQNEKSASGE
jgi:biopolymer transport protein ExbB